MAKMIRVDTQVYAHILKAKALLEVATLSARVTLGQAVRFLSVLGRWGKDKREG